MSIALTPDQTPQTKIEVAGSGEVMTMATREEPDWFEEVLERLKEVAHLESNWDSYGAQQVDVVSVHYANCFVSHFKQYVGIERPNVTATPDGRVAFSWDNGDRSLDVDLDAKGVASYFYESKSGEEEGATSDYLSLIEKLTRL